MHMCEHAHTLGLMWNRNFSRLQQWGADAGPTLHRVVNDLYGQKLPTWGRMQLSDVVLFPGKCHSSAIVD